MRMLRNVINTIANLTLCFLALIIGHDRVDKLFRSAVGTRKSYLFGVLLDRMLMQDQYLPWINGGERAAEKLNRKAGRYNNFFLR